MNKLSIIKTVVSIIASIGVGSIVENAVKSTTPTTIGKFNKICIGLGTLILGAIATEAVSKYTEEAIDKGVDVVKEIVKDQEEKIV